ncbi:MAG: DNA-3-methyladenine glycosylase family protein [Fidelibacterota bacterium]
MPPTLLESSSPVDIEMTLLSGQTFHWHLTGSSGPETINDRPGFVLLHRSSALCLKQVTSKLIHIESFGNPLPKEELRAVTGLNLDLETIRQITSRDNRVKRLIHRYAGLTILRQDPFECLVSFLSSGMSNIPRIRRNLRDLRIELGSPISGSPFYSLPAARVVAEAGESTLRKLGFGFRAKYIARTCAHLVSHGINLNHWKPLPDHDIKSRLLAFPGVGHKIAECVLLFGFGRLTAFPVDVWVGRALQNLWPGHPNRSLERWRRWAKTRWGHTAGYVQQVLFMAARSGILFRRSEKEGPLT